MLKINLSRNSKYLLLQSGTKLGSQFILFYLIFLCRHSRQCDSIMFVNRDAVDQLFLQIICHIRVTA